jgi:diacylglycerol O-acyltransferase / wax synthase
VQALVPHVDFMHTFVRAGNAFAVTVMGPRHAASESGRHLDRYTELLGEGFDEVLAAMAGAGSARPAVEGG